MQAKCTECGRIFERIPSQLKRSENHFCSRSCAIIYSNRKTPRRIKKQYLCMICGVEIPSRRKLCDQHSPTIVNWNERTIIEVQQQSKYQPNAQIRDLARRLYVKSDLPKKCAYCGYNRHYDVCHIKPISSFSKNTPVSTVNELSNLIALCKNHHWELDNGFLDIQQCSREDSNLQKKPD